MNVAELRAIALALPGTVEQPHFDRTSFRVRTKIFATVSPDEKHVHVFVDEAQRETMIAFDPDVYEKLWWGRKVVGLRVALASVVPADIAALLRSAWRRKAPKGLVRVLEDAR
ncbi:MAG: MmcQ/YjbR family DNA-binding protein [Rhodanobacteraceae bacterium]